MPGFVLQSTLWLLLGIQVKSLTANSTQLDKTSLDDLVYGFRHNQMVMSSEMMNASINLKLPAKLAAAEVEEAQQREAKAFRGKNEAKLPFIATKSRFNLGYIGRGYDIYKGNPLSEDGVVDQGFRLPVIDLPYSFKFTADGEYRVPDNVDVISETSARFGSSLTSVKSEEDYQSMLKVDASVEFAASGFGASASFSASSSYQNNKRRTQSQEKTSLNIISRAVVYRARMSETPKVSMVSDFLEGAIAALPRENCDNDRNQELYINLIENFGTHYTTDVVMGAKAVQQLTFSSSELATMESEGLSVQMVAKASYSGLDVSASGSVSAGVETSSEQSKKIANMRKETLEYYIGGTPPSGDFSKGNDYSTESIKDWAKSAAENPVPIQYKLKSIDSLFIESYFRNSDWGIFEKRRCLRKALYTYCKRTVSYLKCSASDMRESSAFSTRRKRQAVEKYVPLEFGDFIALTNQATQRYLKLSETFGYTRGMATKPLVSECAPTNLDILFLVDPALSGQEFKMVLFRLKNEIAKFNVNSGRDRIGLMSFDGSSERIIFTLKDYNIVESIQNAISSVSYTPGAIVIEQAVKYAKNSVFIQQQGARPNANHILVLITKGAVSGDVNAAGTAARASNIRIFSIVLGNSGSREDMEKLAYDPSYFLQIKSSTLPNIANLITSRIPCSGGTGLPEYSGLFRILPIDDQNEKLNTEIKYGEPFCLGTIEGKKLYIGGLFIKDVTDISPSTLSEYHADFEKAEKIINSLGDYSLFFKDEKETFYMVSLNLDTDALSCHERLQLTYDVIVEGSKGNIQVQIKGHCGINIGDHDYWYHAALTYKDIGTAKKIFVMGIEGGFTPERVKGFELRRERSRMKQRVLIDSFKCPRHNRLGHCGCASVKRQCEYEIQNVDRSTPATHDIKMVPVQFSFHSKALPAANPVYPHDTVYVHVLSSLPKKSYWGQFTSHLLASKTGKEIGIMEVGINSSKVQTDCNNIIYPENSQLAKRFNTDNGVTVYFSLTMILKRIEIETNGYKGNYSILYQNRASRAFQILDINSDLHRVEFGNLVTFDFKAPKYLTALQLNFEHGTLLNDTLSALYMKGCLSALLDTSTTDRSREEWQLKRSENEIQTYPYFRVVPKQFNKTELDKRIEEMEKIVVTNYEQTFAISVTCDVDPLFINNYIVTTTDLEGLKFENTSFVRRDDKITVNAVLTALNRHMYDNNIPNLDAVVQKAIQRYPCTTKSKFVSSQNSAEKADSYSGLEIALITLCIIFGVLHIVHVFMYMRRAKCISRSGQNRSEHSNRQV